MKTLKTNFPVILFSILLTTFVSCERFDNAEYVNTSISYMITMSPDLLMFVTPEVTYVDSEGNLHTISGVEELDSLVIENNAATKHFDVWTKQTIKGTNYNCWTLNMTFDNRPFYSYMGVKYKKRDFVEDMEGKEYDFHHSIYSTNILVTSKATTRIKYDWLVWGFYPSTNTQGGALIENHISFTNDRYYYGEEVDQYIEDLVNTPDKLGFMIDTEGGFTEKNDFSLD